MIRSTLHHDDLPSIDPAVLEHPDVKAYLGFVDTFAPGIELTADRAVQVGFLAAIEIRAARWEEHRALAAQTFDPDSFDVLAVGAVTFLDPGPVPEPFASILSRAEAALAAQIAAEIEATDV